MSIMQDYENIRKDLGFKYDAIEDYLNVVSPPSQYKKYEEELKKCYVNMMKIQETIASKTRDVIISTYRKASYIRMCERNSHKKGGFIHEAKEDYCTAPDCGDGNCAFQRLQQQRGHRSHRLHRRSLWRRRLCGHSSPALPAGLFCKGQ